MMRPLSLIALSSCLLSACGSSPPTRFYALSEVAPTSTSAVSGDANAVPVRVEPVAIPAELDRLELVHHTGPNQVQVSDFDRWAAPLDEQIRRVLSEDLSARLPAGWVTDPNEPSTGDPRRRLSIEIGRFEANEGCAVTLHASWTLRAAHAGSSRSGVERIDVPATSPCPASLAAAMSRALAALADRLASTLQSP